MFVKLAIFSCLVVAATAVWNGPLAGGVPAHQYPAGVSPQACPNFPNCNNPAVAANPNAPAPYGGYNPAPYNQYNPAPVPNYNPSLQSALDRGEYTGDGDYHGEGLAESGAYGNTGQWNNNNNNGQWNPAQNNGQWNNPGAWNPAPAAYPNGVPAQIPAGVDARACPNYPFCH